MDKYNIEHLLLLRLLKSNAQDIKAFQKYPLTVDFFHTYNQQFRFIQEFKEKYNKLPSLKAFKRKFPEFKVLKTQESIDYYCNELIEREHLIRFKLVTDRVRPLIEEGKNTEALTEIKNSLVDSIFVNYTGGGINWVSRGKERYQEAVVDRARLLKEGKVYRTPYKGLNKHIVALRPENVVTIAGRTAYGKTWILLLFALYFLKCGARVLLISKEMSASEFEDRLDAMDARLDFKRFQRGNLSKKQRKRLIKCMKRRKQFKGKLRIVGESSLDNSGLEQLIQEIDNFHPDVVCIDGTYHFDIKGFKDEVQRAMNLSRKIKRIAKARKVLICQTVQVNRSGEGRKRGGGLASIAFSDAWAQDSDLMMEVIAPKGRDSDFRKLAILKGRNDGYGEININFRMSPCLDLSENFRYSDTVESSDEEKEWKPRS